MLLVLLSVLVGFLLFVVAVAVAVVLLRRPAPQSYALARRPPFSTPLERAQTAASVLTPDESEQFRRWVDGQTAAPAHSDPLTKQGGDRRDEV